ncbi:hypothetical protein GGR50DRAFT_658567 [Xylaria sp. CBS 124048]|nr:hypothetical protein GGR50DRAFT_658567 [Xylaria sp. CBS 124048]
MINPPAPLIVPFLRLLSLLFPSRDAVGYLVGNLAVGSVWLCHYKPASASSFLLQRHPAASASCFPTVIIAQATVDTTYLLIHTYLRTYTASNFNIPYSIW